LGLEGSIQGSLSKFELQFRAVKSDQENRIRELVFLISDEHNPENIKILANELGRLLSSENKPWPISLSEKPKPN